MIKKIIIIAGLLGSATVSAEIISYGNLVSDDNYNIVADTNLGREYLRFDSYSLNYKAVLEAISEGGHYEGWSIADSYINDDFINAMLGGNSGTCDSEIEIFGNECGRLMGWSDGDFGNSFDHTNDYWAYLSTKETESRDSDLGYARIENSGKITDFNDFTNFNNTNIQSGYIKVLLYRDNHAHTGGFDQSSAIKATLDPSAPVTPVPIGGSGVLLASLLALFGFRRKCTS